MSRLVAFLLTVLVGWLLTQLDSPETAPRPAQQKMSAPASAAVSTVKPQPRRKTAAADDLTQIDGIGPAAEKALKALGIQTFKQLAAQDADQLAARLPKLLGSRVKRDGWIKQAEQLAKQ